MNIELIDYIETVCRDDTSIAEVKMSKPIFTGGSSSKRLTKYYDETERSFFDWLKTVPEPLAKPVEVSCRVTLNDGEIVSLYRDISVNSQLIRIADTWKNGYPISLRQLGLKRGDLIKSCLASCEELAKSGYVSLLPEYRASIQKNFDKDNFYIEPDKLVIFYNPGIVARKSLGVMEFKLDGTALSQSPIVT